MLSVRLNILHFAVAQNSHVYSTNISESVFIEIRNTHKKNVIIGCIYRHHTPVSDFLETFLNDTLKTITKSKKICALLGDFNLDLIKYGTNSSVESFYDIVSTHGFRPLILQPTRVLILLPLLTTFLLMI